MVYCTLSDGFANRLFQQMGICPDFYFTFLYVTTAAFGYWVHRKVEGVHARKWTSTAFALLLLLAVCGSEVWHVLLVTFVAVAIIKRTDNNSKGHWIVAALMATYLALFRLYALHNRNAFIPMNAYLSFLTLRIVGVAFEMHYSRKGLKMYSDGDDRILNPTYEDILHYCFAFVGFIGVAYLRYRTYDDFIKMPFYKYAFDKGFMNKFTICIASMVGFSLLEATWPLNYVNTDDFQRGSILYKLTYSMIVFQTFKLWLLGYVTMGECVCSASGFGGYPVEFQSIGTHGPTKNYDKLKEMSEQDAQRSEYDFATNTTMDVYVVLTCPWAKICQRVWNIHIQYFMGMYVYKSIPKNKYIKSLRKVLTFAVSGLWHGIEPGYLMGMLLVSVYFPTDELFLKIHTKLRGWKAHILAAAMYIILSYFIAFSAMTFLLLDLKEVMKFYNAVNYLPIIILPIVHLVGVVLLQTMRGRIQLDFELKSE